MAYKVSIDGESWLTDELTLDEACSIEDETGVSWHYMEPLNSAKLAKAIIARFLARRVGDVALAQARLGGMTVTEILACIEKVEQPKKKAAAKRAPKAPSPENLEASEK